MNTVLAHEKLHVYQHGLQFVSWKEALLSEVDKPAAALDHLSRASESIVEAIANGNSRRSKQNRNRYLNIAVGSGLECAACLDICECKHVISIDTNDDQKKFLDIAHTSLMKTAARLDLLVAKASIPSERVAEGKQILTRLVPMTLGLRGYLDQDADTPD